MDDFDPGKAGLPRLAVTVPPLPSTLRSARSLMDAVGTVTATDTRSTIDHDPVVVAQVLRVANAAHYGSQRTVDGIGRATDLLGPVTVLGIVSGMNLASGAGTVPDPAMPCFMRLIRHSIAVAGLTGVVHRHLSRVDLTEDAYYTAGLVHDLGRILMVHRDPERAVAVFERPAVLRAGDPEDLLHLEQVAFGHDHTEAGAYVARTLDFPDRLVHAIRHHHDPGPFGPDAVLTAAVSAADVAASALGFPFSTERSWGQCADHPAWRHLPVDDLPGLFRDLRRHADEGREAVDTRVRPPAPWRRSDGASRSEAVSPADPPPGTS